MERERIARELLAAGREKRTAGDPAAAATAFEQAQRAHPGSEAAKEAKADLEALLKDPEAAAKVEASKKEKEANRLLTLARQWMRNGREDEARKKYDELIQKFPGTTQAEEAKAERPGRTE